MAQLKLERDLQEVHDKRGTQPHDRVKTGDDLIPKTTFKPLSKVDKLIGPHLESLSDLKDLDLAQDMMRIYMGSGIIPIAWGPVGAAKTRTIQAMNREVDEAGVPYRVITVQPSTEDPTAFHGLVTVVFDHGTQKHITERAVPNVVDEVIQYFNNFDGLTILFLDELTTCSPAQQNALLGLMTHQNYGGVDISDYTTVVCAANPPNTVATTIPLSEALINRCGHLSWCPDPERWLGAFKTGFGNPLKKPDDYTRQFAEKFVTENEENLFRSITQEWSPDDLIPWEQLQSTPRSTDNFFKVVPTIRESFANSPADLRIHYLTKAGVSLMGQAYEQSVRRIATEMEDEVNPGQVMQIVRERRVGWEWNEETLKSRLGTELHIHDRKTFTADREKSMADGLLRLVYDNDVFDDAAYLSLFAFCCTAPNDNLLQTTMICMTQAYIIAAKQQETDNWRAGQSLLPDFVNGYIRERIKHLLEMM